jgi:hypothetical protein
LSKGVYIDDRNTPPSAEGGVRKRNKLLITFLGVKIDFYLLI